MTVSWPQVSNGEKDCKACSYVVQQLFCFVAQQSYHLGLLTLLAISMWIGRVCTGRSPICVSCPFYEQVAEVAMRSLG